MTKALSNLTLLSGIETHVEILINQTVPLHSVNASFTFFFHPAVICINITTELSAQFPFSCLSQNDQNTNSERISALSEILL